MVIHAFYIGIIAVLFAVLIWQRIRAGFWKRMHDNAWKNWCECLVLLKEAPAAIQPQPSADWPDEIEVKDK